MSPTDIIIKITPGGGDDIRLETRVNGRAPVIYQRTGMPDLHPDLIAEIRRGNPGRQRVRELARTVSKWLLADDLGPVLQAELTAKTRIIFQYDSGLKPSIFDVPFELIELNEDDPLVLQPRIRAIVHEPITRTGVPAHAEATSGWPLEILLVRAAPQGFDPVPPILPIADAIRKSTRMPAQLLRVTCLTTEDGTGTDGKAMLPRLAEIIDQQPPHIVVFLGHGDVNPSFTDHVLPCAVYFEDANQRPDPVSSTRLRNELTGKTGRTVPLVILAGCFTAAQPQAAAGPGGAAAPEASSRRLEGIQGMAQTLVAGAMGIQVAVGTRARIDSSDAQTFLTTFFDSLLARNPGDVDAAIHGARREVNRRAPTSFGCYTPAVFRSGHAGAPFDFLLHSFRRPPAAEDLATLSCRRLAWKALADLPAGTIDGAQGICSMLDTIEALQVFQRALARPEALVVPSRVHASARQVDLSVKLHGAVTLKLLEGLVRIPSSARVLQVKRGKAAIQSGMWLCHHDGIQSVIEFRLHHPEHVVDIEQGSILEICLEFDGKPGQFHEVAVELIKTEPVIPIRGEANAIIVPLA
jgi:CHAT domain